MPFHEIARAVSALPTSRPSTPFAVVDRDRLQANIDRVARLAADRGQALRPHAKTHKCPQIAALQRGTEVVVGTPGRLIDLMERGVLDLAHVTTVVLDEAFDRADPEYTRRAMDVFTNFGFHMVLATPLKLLQTLEPYIGGLVVVGIEDGSRSRIERVTWEAAS